MIALLLAATFMAGAAAFIARNTDTLEQDATDV